MNENIMPSPEEICGEENIWQPRFDSCMFVPLTEIVTPEFSDFFELLSSSEPGFSWGDNNRTLVRIDRIISHCDDTPELAEYMQENPVLWDRFKSLDPDTYVDLEN